MNRQEHLLACLAEECDEVGQRVMKALRFGLDEVQSGQSMTNDERIAMELRDLLSVAQILLEEGALTRFSPTPEEIAEKQAKIERYMEISRREGVLA